MFTSECVYIYMHVYVCFYVCVCLKHMCVSQLCVCVCLTVYVSVCACVYSQESLFTSILKIWNYLSNFRKLSTIRREETVLQCLFSLFPITASAEQLHFLLQPYSSSGKHKLNKIFLSTMTSMTIWMNNIMSMCEQIVA